VIYLRQPNARYAFLIYFFLTTQNKKLAQKKTYSQAFQLVQMISIWNRQIFPLEDIT